MSDTADPGNHDPGNDQPNGDATLVEHPADERDPLVEIRASLEDDTSRLGDVYRLRREGLSAAEMAERLGVPSVGFAYNYGQQVDALLEGRVPASANIAAQTAARVRSLLKKLTWSPEAEQYLVDLERRLDSAASDPIARSREDDEAAKRTAAAEQSGVPGIYVYSLPHYVRYPYDPDTGHTLFKVGRSDVDIFGRVAGQARTTALPEDPILIRIYRTSAGETVEAERYFHSLLEAADHSRSRASRGGREWFLTTTKFLDRLAQERRLDIDMVSDQNDGA